MKTMLIALIVAVGSLAAPGVVLTQEDTTAMKPELSSTKAAPIKSGHVEANGVNYGAESWAEQVRTN